VVELYKISAFTRHSPTKKMYNLSTACGRSATLTADHNLWVLREGRLQLIRTEDAQPTDYMPVPRTLLAEGHLESFDTLAALSGKRHFVEAQDAIAAYMQEHGADTLVQTISNHGISGYRKLYAIQHGGRGRGIQVSVFEDVLKATSYLDGHWRPEAARVGSKRKRQALPGRLALTPEFLRLFGYYIAEGNCQAKSGFFILANRNDGIRNRV